MNARGGQTTVEVNESCRLSTLVSGGCLRAEIHDLKRDRFLRT